MEHMQLIYLTEVYLVAGWLRLALQSYYLAFFSSLKNGQNTYYVLKKI